MTYLAVRADARHLPLPDGSVDLVITSPPYWALRSYTDNGEHYEGQIGSETTPAEWVDALIECTAEMVRVLKPEGSIWIDLGDKYSDRADGGPSSARSGRGDHAEVLPPGRSSIAFAPRKSLLLLPERYRIACVDQLGLIARAVVVWDKPNGLPESVTDRVRRSHEDWVHLVRQPRYYSAVDEIREPYAAKTFTTLGSSLVGQRGLTEHAASKLGTWGQDHGLTRADIMHPLGKLPGSVWSIPSEPLVVPDGFTDHFAAFPSEWPRRLILGWSPPGICVECNMGRSVRRFDEATTGDHDGLARRLQARAGMCGLRDNEGAPGLRSSGQGDAAVPDLAAAGLAGRAATAGDREVRHPMRGVPYAEALGGGDEGASERPEEAAMLLREALDGPGDVQHALLAVEEERRSSPTLRKASLICSCPPTTPTRPAVVLDPFGGTGTTAHVAHALGRTGISVDLSADYCRLAAHPEMAARRYRKVHGLEAPPKPIPGQQDLFTDTASPRAEETA